MPLTSEGSLAPTYEHEESSNSKEKAGFPSTYKDDAALGPVNVAYLLHRVHRQIRRFID